MKLIGVTGGIGSGKSEVCRVLATLGCVIFNADAAAKRLQETDFEVVRELKHLFGKEIYSEQDGKEIPNRKRIAEIVFADQSKLTALNRIIHPRVFDLFDHAAAEAEKENRIAFVKEAAILFESGRGKTGLDVVIVVAADLEIRIARVSARSGLSRGAALERIHNQWPQEKLVGHADHVIWNNGSLDDLNLETVKVFHSILPSETSSGN
ncbi:MAG: dephospho-CoA kinase [Rhizobacter sp.]|nr:dephospho-CoA kinase [Chlorobiales bacterium]